MIDVSKNNIGSSRSKIKELQSIDVWSGSAHDAFDLQVSELLSSLEKEENNLNTFQNALNLLEELKKIDDDINSLNNQVIEIPDDASESTILEYEEFNSNISLSISAKNVERTEIRSKIVNILSGFGIIADIMVIDIPNIEGAKVLYEYDSGCIYEFTTSDGQVYEAYVPYQVDPTAPVIVYDSGGNSGNNYNSSTDWIMLKEYFEENGHDHIVLRSMRRDSSLYYQDICEKLNLSPESRLFISHSGGFRTQFEEYYDLMIDEGSKPGVLAMMDGYINGDKKIIDKLVEDETILFCFHQNYMNESGRNYIKYGDTGLNMLILSDKSEFGMSHAGTRLSLVDNGVLDYLTGKGTLPDNYEIKYYNPDDANADTNGYVILDHSCVATLDDVYAFFGVEK